MNGSTLARQFFSSGYSLKVNLEDISHEDSLFAPERGGNCINWIVGHILNSRNRLFGFVGLDQVWDASHAEVYGRGTVPLTSSDKAIPLDTLVQVFDASQERLIAHLKAMSADALNAALPEPHKLFGKTVETAVAFSAFHELYHVGQVSLLRRALGREGAIP